MEVLRRSRFDRLIEKATNEMLIEPDIESTVAICDLIRGQELSPKSAVLSVKKRLQHDNDNVVMHALYVLEFMMKNCGAPVHEEVATSDFMQTLYNLTSRSYDIRNQVLAYVQNWAFVFKGKSGFSAVQDTYDRLKNDGYTFPDFSENDAMFSVVCAPDWKEESSCHRCKVMFGAFRRRHHCRNCGNSFCAECSSERAVLPKYGIEKEVRVCDHCFELLSHGPPEEKKPPPSHEDQTRKEKELKARELETREAEELELALALSASEAESKELERRGGNYQNPPKANEPPQSIGRTGTGRLQLLPVLDTTDMDPDLARYLNRHYWENRAAALNQPSECASNHDVARSSPIPVPSAPLYSPTPSSVQSLKRSATENATTTTTKTTTTSELHVKSGNENNTHLNLSSLPGLPELTSPKQEEFLNALRASIEFFVNRMQSNSQRGRSIANDTTVQALFLTLHEMHPQLLQYKQSMEERRAFFECLQDKLTQLREAREALDALRQEHAARRQLEEQEAARLRQLQVMQKLEVMRQQKRETLEYRRRMAMEQTMQYQQQYQPQPMVHTIDPVTGMPFSKPSGPYSQAYSVQQGTYQPLGSTQSPFGLLHGTYGPAPVSAEVGYGTSEPERVPPYTHLSQVQPQFQYNPHLMGQPVQSNVSFTQHPGLYSMRQLDTSLATVSDSHGAYRQPTATLPVPVRPPTENQTSTQPTYGELPEPPRDEPRPVSPPSVTAVTQVSQENQLILFD